MQRPRRILGYCRVSSAEQALGTSLRDQQAAIEAFAKARGVDTVRMYVEAESGIREKEERREQVQALLREVRPGDLVVVDKLDRWSRDIVFTVSKVREVLARGAGFFSVAEGIDAADPNSAMMLEMRGVFAGEEHRRIRIRTVGTRRLLRDRGYYTEGTPPTGYRRRPGTKGIEKNVLEVVPEEAELVRAIFRRYVGGESMARVARALGVNLMLVKDALDRRFYLGEIRTSAGEWIRGQHPALVDASLFNRAQARKVEARKGGPRPREAVSETSEWILRDVARCGACGAKMTSSYGGRNVRKYYYRCFKACRSKGNRATNGSYVPVADAEASVTEAVLGRLAELREELAKGPEPESAPQMVDFDAKRRQLDARRERIVQAFEDGAIDRDALRVRLGRLDAERLKLEALEVEATTANVLESLETRRTVLRELAVIRRAWAAMTPPERRIAVNILVVEARLTKGAEPVYVWRTAEDLAASLG
jgi:site-specific DNA recombinase